MVGYSVPGLERIQSLNNNTNAPAEFFYKELRNVMLYYESYYGDSKQIIWKVACINGKEYDVFRVNYINPSLITFIVIDENNEQFELLMNVASVQFIIKVVELKVGEKKRIIGFDTTPTGIIQDEIQTDTSVNG